MKSFVVILISLFVLINGCNNPSTVSNDTVESDLIALPLELPTTVIIYNHSHPKLPPNIEPITKRPPFFVPKSVKNVARNKPVSSSELDPIIGNLEMIVDGVKESYEKNIVELGPFKQWVQVDLENEYELYAIVFWHYHRTLRIYYDVVVQVSNNKEFNTDVTTLFNNDIDNSLGLGAGQDQHYFDTTEGKLVDVKGIKARYVRLYSQGNTDNDLNHYLEVEVYGK
ncbi:MAG: discoidin domain-containing protein [Sedimentisphaerales bacterium]|nr:discoidin domain-containing protein [Sedimentisphaerales bacterium]